MKYKIISIISLLFIIFSINCYAADSDKDILDKAPVDVVYKYIDLRDKALNRKKKIVKDLDNEELRYSIRSVLKNIPWVRKIYIIMPNEKVRFLKEPDEINDKIVYVKDKDLLGYDSASSITFEFNFWRLKDFGCSENFIYLNDDYFIGKPLKKSDFFYVNNKGKVVPYIFTRGKKSATIVNYNTILNQCSYLKNIVDNSAIKSQTSALYRFQTWEACRFLYKVFNKKKLRLVISTSHNAEGYNLKDSKELYDLVNSRYKYAKECLGSTYRHKSQLTNKALYNNYFLNKENRKIGKIDCAYIDMGTAGWANFNRQLFCINTAGGRVYSNWERKNAKNRMKKLFPRKSIYEK